MVRLLWSPARAASCSKAVRPLARHRYQPVYPSTRRTLATQSSSQSDFRIPLIDFAPFLSPLAAPSQKRATADAVVNAFKATGFVYLSNHGIAEEQVGKVFGKVREFFVLPQEKKDTLAWEDPRANRGYVRRGRERVTQSTSASEIAALRLQAPDSKESMEIGREWESVWRNRWPGEGKEGGVEGFRGTMLEFFQTCHDTHTHVMRAIALGLRLPEDFFDTKINEQWHNLRLLQYPAIDAALLQREGQARAGAHSDYGTLTLLFQDEVGGLEVQNPHTKQFYPAPPIPGTIVVNVGDLLSRWSNDTLRSTLHRVVAPPARRVTLTPSPTSGHQQQQQVEVVPQRNSIAFFCNPNFGATVECLPTCVGEEGAKYAPVGVEEYIVGRLSDTYT